VEQQELEEMRRAFWRAKLDDIREVQRQAEADLHASLETTRGEISREMSEMLEGQLSLFEKHKEDVLTRMQLGSFVAENEYSVILECEPRITAAKVTLGPPPSKCHTSKSGT
jgi:hypothetical protein